MEMIEVPIVVEKSDGSEEFLQSKHMLWKQRCHSYWAKPLQHKKPKVIEAKKKGLDNLDYYGTFEEVNKEASLTTIEVDRL